MRYIEKAEKARKTYPNMGLTSQQPTVPSSIQAKARRLPDSNEVLVVCTFSSLVGKVFPEVYGCFWAASRAR